MSAKTSFGKIGAYLWPIRRDETKKFIPTLLIFFLVGFNYSLLRAIKDALVVTAPASGAEALPFLKVWAIVPFALLFTFIFTRVSNRVSREKVFYVMMSILSLSSPYLSLCFTLFKISYIHITFVTVFNNYCLLAYKGLSPFSAIGPLRFFMSCLKCGAPLS